MQKPRTERLVSCVVTLVTLLLVSTACLANSYDEAMDAARTGNTRQLVGLLDRGIDPDSVDSQMNSLLIIAAREGHAGTVEALLRYRPNVSHRNLVGDSALMLATLKGDADTVDMLLAAGARVNHDGWTPLMYAAFQGHLALVERFLAEGAEVNALAPNQANALMVAARNGHIDVVRRLLATEVDLEQKSDRGFTAESWAMENGNTDIAGLIRAERAKRPQPALRIEIQ